MSARSILVDGLTPLVPDDWRVMPYVDTIDGPDRMTLLVKITDIEPKIRGAYLTSADLVLIAPQGENIPAAEEALDDAIFALLSAIESGSAYAWSKASVGTVADLNTVAWTVSVQIITIVTPDTPDSDSSDTNPDPDPDSEGNNS